MLLLFQVFFNELCLLRIQKSIRNKILKSEEVELWCEWEEKKFIQIRIDSSGDYIDHLPSDISQLQIREVFD